MEDKTQMNMCRQRRAWTHRKGEGTNIEGNKLDWGGRHLVTKEIEENFTHSSVGTHATGVGVVSQRMLHVASSNACRDWPDMTHESIFFLRWLEYALLGL